MHEKAYVVCVDGVSKGVFDVLPEEYEHLPLYDYEDALIFPGMVDLHIHAPQYAFRGMCMDLELMDWLNQYTFPEEEKYTNLDYAKKAYSIFTKALKNSATTRACIFATRHRYATELLMELMEKSGLGVMSPEELAKNEQFLAMLRAISPVTYVQEGTPTTLLSYGRQDTLVVWENVNSLMNAFATAGVEYTLVEYPNSGHGLDKDPDSVARTAEAMAESLRAAFGY